jgi:Mg-chelatase subunit ChlD
MAHAKYSQRKYSSKGLWSWYDDDDDYDAKYPAESEQERKERWEKMAAVYKAERQREKANRMVQVVSTYASVLAFQPVRCYVTSVNDENQAPAWSDSGSIGFHLESLPDLDTPIGAMVVKGLAIHEIGHILFTARIGTELRDFVIEKDFSIAYNILEDSRLEALMIGRFGKTIASWLSGVVARYITDGTPEQLAKVWPLIAGRHYLPAELRLALRSAFYDQSIVDRIEELASEYRTMLFKTPDLVDRAKEIITEFDSLLEKQSGGDDGSGSGGCSGGWTIAIPDPFGHHHRPVNENNGGSVRPVSNKDKDKASQKAEKSTCNLPPSSESNKQVTDADEVTSRDAGAGNDQLPTVDPNLLSDIINQGKKLLEVTEKTLAKELSNDLANYSGKAELLATSISDLEVARHKTEQPGADAVAGSRAFRLQLQRLKNDYLPEMVRRTPLGKINASRYLSGCDLDEAFDRFEEGNDEVASIEAVILLDRSGSMGNDITAAYEAMWAVKKALDEIGASASVITFSNTSEVLYSANEKATTEMRTNGCGGGTDPTKAVIAARNIFATTKRPVKLFMAITDGEWSAGWGQKSDYDEVIRELRRAGVLTSLVTIKMTPNNVHNCEMVANIKNATDLFPLAKNLVSVAIQRNLGHH